MDQEKLEEQLEEKLQALSTHFKRPDKAYLLLNRIAKEGNLSDLELQLANLQQKAGEGVTTFSEQLLVEYLESEISLDKVPPTLPILGSAHLSNQLGNGNRQVYSYNPSSTYEDGNHPKD